MRVATNLNTYLDSTDQNELLAQKNVNVLLTIVEREKRPELWNPFYNHIWVGDHTRTAIFKRAKSNTMLLLFPECEAFNCCNASIPAIESVDTVRGLVINIL